MNDLFSERVFNIPWVLVAAVAIGIAVIYAFVPADAGSEGIGWFVLRWGRSIAWVFLAAAAFVRSKVPGWPVEMAAPFAATGGLAYVALMITTMAGG